MSGPIVRSGPSKVYSSNWDSVFEGKKTKAKDAAPKKKVPAKKKAGKKKG